MRIVVTGGAGFIGRHLVERLCEQGAQWGITHESPLVVLDNFTRSTPATLEHLTACGTVRLVEGDVRDMPTVDDLLADAAIVFHLAGQSNVLGAEREPGYAFEANVVGTQHVLEAALAHGARRVVFASSREVYGQPERLPVPEDAAYAPKNVYGASKAAGEMLCRAAAGRGLATVALRLANVYGTGDSGRIVPLWLARAARGDDLIAYGGTQTLDLVWVGDVVCAMLAAATLEHPVADAVADAPRWFLPLNVGSGRGVTLHALAEHIRNATGSQARVRVEPARSAEVEAFVADVSCLRAVLGISPDTTLRPLYEMAEQAVHEAQRTAQVAGPDRVPAPAGSTHGE